MGKGVIERGKYGRGRGRRGGDRNTLGFVVREVGFFGIAFARESGRERERNERESGRGDWRW